MKPALIALALGLSTLAGCATMEPEPCTAEWVDFKKDKILRSFAVENRGLIRDFRKLANADGDINPLTAISLLQNTKRIERFTDSFTGNVVPQLEAAFEQCNASDNLVPALTDFLRDEGVSDSALKTIGPVLVAAMEMRRQNDASNPPGQ
jgi:hypothetical protein